MSSTRIPHSKFSSQVWLINILSISVAVLLVIQVGLVIVGTRPSDRLVERNLSVGACFVDFNRSRLWSSPITIPLFSLFSGHTQICCNDL